MIIKDNMANMCAKVTSTYMEFTLAFGPKPEFSFSFKLFKNSFNYGKYYLLISEHMFYIMGYKGGEREFGKSDFSYRCKFCLLVLGSGISAAS